MLLFCIMTDVEVNGWN